MKTIAELEAIRQRTLGQVGLRKDHDEATRVVVGMATCGIAAGARVAMNTIIEEINKLGIKNVAVTATGCVGLCYAEPLVEIRQPGKPTIRYGNVDAARAKEIVDKHIVKGELVNNAIVGQGVPS